MCETVRAAMRTDLGVVRERNEDAAHVDPAARFVILADGMGGHSAGDIASSMAVELVRERLAAARFDGRDHVRGLVDAAIRSANEAILDRSAREPDKHGMGTTLEVLVFTGDELFLSHVGDSRTYLIRDGSVHQLTVDHTMAETMRRAGAITAEEALVSPLRSALSSAIGVMQDITIDHVELRLQHGDRLLVCSDGLHDYFTSDELAEHLLAEGAEPALAAMIDAARERGGHDNITGIVVDVGTPDAAPDPLDDLPTQPVSVGPFAGVGEQTMTDFLDRALTEPLN